MEGCVEVVTVLSSIKGAAVRALGQWGWAASLGLGYAAPGSVPAHPSPLPSPPQPSQPFPTTPHTAGEGIPSGGGPYHGPWRRSSSLTHICKSDNGNITTI